jgi:hypothetical protein
MKPSIQLDMALAVALFALAQEPTSSPMRAGDEVSAWPSALPMRISAST